MDLLKQLADLEEDHNGGRFLPVLHGKRTHRRKGHQELLVKDLPAQDVPHGGPEHVIAGDQPRRKHQPGLPPAL